MKKRYYLIMLLLLAVLNFGSVQKALATQLSGVYTIDPSLVASTTNFKDFQSAVNYLTGSVTRPDGGPSNIAPFGVNGPVIFNVSAGTYPLSSTLNIDYIEGSSPVNTILFDGGTGNASTRILVGSAPSNPLVRLNQCKYVSFQNLTINNTSAGNCAGISIRGSSSSVPVGGIQKGGTGCSIKNCIVNLAISNTSGRVGISVTSSLNGFSTSGTSADSIEIDDNVITGGFTGIMDWGNNSDTCNRQHKFRFNQINGVDASGIQIIGIYNAIEVAENKVQMSSSGGIDFAFGITLANCKNNSGVISHKINNNYVNGANQYGIYIGSLNGGINCPTKIYNNMIVGFKNSGSSGNSGLFITVDAGYYTEVYHNSISVDVPFTGDAGYFSQAFYYSGSDNLQCKNNLFAYSALSGTSGLAATFDNVNPPLGNVNYNIYLNRASEQLISMGGGIYTVNNYRVASVGGDSSFCEMSFGNFESEDDLHLNSSCLNGINLSAAVPFDIDGDLRSTSPVIGCDEGIGKTNNIALLGIISPVGLFNGNTQVKVKFKNEATSVLNTANFILKINNIIVDTEVYAGALAPCNIDSVIFDFYNFIPGETFDVSVYSEAPNGQLDSVLTNDTIQIIYNPALSGGVYSIDPSGTGPNNFISFDDAALKLRNGLLNPILINVAIGSYPISSTINIDEIPGNQQVVFDGGAGNASTRVISGSIASGPVIRLNQCKNVQLRNLSIINTYAGSCSGVAIVGNILDDAGSKCGVRNCIINLPNTGSSPSSGIGIMGDLDGYSSAIEQRADSIELDSNIFNYGQSAISIYGKGDPLANRGIKIRNNQILNTYSYGILTITVNNALKIQSNDINISSTGSTDGSGIFMYFCQNNSNVESHIIANNRIVNAGSTGIYLRAPRGTVVNPTKIYNNTVAGGFRGIGNGSVPGCGLCLSTGSNDYTEVYHNTILFDVASETEETFAIYSSGSSRNLKCKNNIFVHSGGFGIGKAAYFNGTRAINANINYNIYYNKASSTLLLNNDMPFTNTSYRSNDGGGDSSFNFRPAFLSNIDLHLANACGEKGIKLSEIPLDIDGQLRNATPDIGSDEGVAIGTNDIEVVSILNPQGFSGMQNISVNFKNVGNGSITSAKFFLKINNVVVDSFLYSGSLLSCAVDTFIFSSAYNFLSKDSFVVTVFSASPNGLTDVYLLNDTVERLYYGALSGGTYTIDSNGSGSFNFVSFTEACATINRFGVSGPISIIITPGVYTEQATLKNVIGVSSTNTITFEGVDATTRILEYGQIDPIDAHTFLIQNTTHVRIKNLTIRNTSNTTGIALHIRGQSHNFRVKGCVIECTGIGMLKIDDPNNFHNVVFNDAPASNDLGNNSLSISDCQIDSNVIRYGSNGIRCLSVLTNSTIIGNSIDTTEQGISGGCDGVIISNNKITNPWVTDKIDDLSNGALRVIGCIFIGIPTNTAQSTIVSGNKIYGYNSGINLGGGSTDSLGPRTRVFNNFLKGANPYGYNSCGINLQPDACNFDILHNTVILDPHAGRLNSVAFADNGSRQCKVRNNHFICKTRATYAVSVRDAASLGNVNIDLDYNNYYSVDSIEPLIQIYGQMYTQTNFIGGGGYNSHSFNKRVSFVGDNDLHIRDNCLLIGDSSTSIKNAIGGIDIDGEVRGLFPSIGADEYVPGGNDIGIDTLVTPVFPFNGIQQLKVRIKNTGSGIVYADTVKVSINGGIPQAAYFTGVLNPCDTATVTFINPYNFISGFNYSIKIWSELPNGNPDMNNVNDTLAINACAALNGSYTINPNGTGSNNYTSIEDAVQALYCAGVNGNVEFNIANGHYKPFVIMYNIPGSSVDNRILFQSFANNADSVIITNVGGYGSSSVAINASYLSFNKITFADSSVNDYEINLIQVGEHNSPSYIRIENCQFTSLPGSSLTSQQMGGFGAQWSYLPGKNYILRGNKFISGRRGMRGIAITIIPSLGGSGVEWIDSVVIEDNIFESINTEGGIINLFCVKNYLIKGNRISTASSLTNTNNSYGISCGITDGYNRIVNNRINGLAGTGIALGAAAGYGGFTANTLISNNYIALGSNNHQAIGIWTAGGMTRLYNNTVFIKSTIPPFNGTSPYCVVFGSITDISKNNIFVSKHPTSPSCRVNEISSLFSDYNNIYSFGINLVEKETPSNPLTFSNIFQWKATGNDLNSVSYWPGFLNDSVVMPDPADSSSWSVNGRGIHLPEVTDDIDGNPRPATIAEGVPDIGAYEFTPTSIPPAAVASPATPVAGSAQTFMFGGDTVGQINWDISSALPASVTLRQYTGQRPPSLISSDPNYMYTYSSVDLAGMPTSSALGYSMDLYYKDAWLGTTSAESSLRPIRKHFAGDPWLLDLNTSMVDTVQNVISSSLYYNYSDTSIIITGTDMSNPLPVKLLTLTATNLKGDVHVNWATASEVNSSYFMVERSLDGKLFKAIGKVKAKGNKGDLSNYQLVDFSAPFSQASTLYYRLKIVDADGSYEYSDKVSVSVKQVAQTAKPLIYPNPFNDEVFATLSLEEAAKVNIRVMDITGKVVLSREMELSKGVQTLKLSTVDLHPGMYFMGIEVGGVVHTQKITRD